MTNLLGQQYSWNDLRVDDTMTRQWENIALYAAARLDSDIDKQNFKRGTTPATY